MIDSYIQYLYDIIPDKDSLKIVRNEAIKFYKENTFEICYNTALGLYQSDNFQIQEVGVFLLGYIADSKPEALNFLKYTVSRHESWKVQEILAMAFDHHCSIIGYEQALPLIKQWLGDDNANLRRAVSEGLRVWTSRDYFKSNPDIAIMVLSEHRNDESKYVRKSIGNALRDISKKYPELIEDELSKWDISIKEVNQVYKLAAKYI